MKRNSFLKVLILSALNFCITEMYAWQTPLINSPANGDTSKYGSFLLNWNAVPNSTAYQVEVDTTPLFNSGQYSILTINYIGTANNGADNEYEYTNFFYGHMFYWRVRAYIPNDTSAWSATMNNFIETNGPVIFGASPPNQTGCFFDWDFERNVSWYDFEIDTTPQFNSPAKRKNTKALIYNNSYNTDTRQQWAGMYYGITHYWHVRSRTSVDTSDWSLTTTYLPPDTVTGITFYPITVNNALPAGTFNASYQLYIHGYQWEIDTSIDFNSPALKGDTVYSSWITNTNIQGSFQDLFYGTDYHFRVRSFNQFDTSDWAIVNFQTVADCKIYSPINEIKPDPSFDLRWLGHYLVNDYEWEVDTSSDYNSPAYKHGIVSHGPNVNTYFYTASIKDLYYNSLYYIRLRAINNVDTSEWNQTTYQVTSDGPNLIYPADSSTETQPGINLKWNGHYLVSGYDYQIDSTPGFNSPLAVFNATTNGSPAYAITYQLAKNLYYGSTYYWRIRSRNAVDTSDWSATWHFTVTNYGPSLFSPANGSAGTNPYLLLDWNAQHYVKGYILDADTNSLFNSSAHLTYNTFYYDTTSNNSDTRYYLNNYVYYSVYYWRIKAYNNVDTSDWSVVWSYDLSSISPLLLAPANGTLNTQPAVLIDWKAHLQARAYFWEVDTSMLFNSAVKQSGKTQSLGLHNNGNDTQEKIANLFYGKKYYWHVASKNAVDTSKWSAPFTFTVTPIGPPLVSPANSVINMAVNGVTLDWNAHDSVKYYEVQLDTSLQFNSMQLTSVIKNYTGFQNNNNDTKYTTNTLLPFTDYYWHVRSMNNVDTSDWTPSFKFTTGAITAPLAPLQISPLNNDTVQNLNVLLNWNAVYHVNDYEVEIDTVAAFNSLWHQSFLQNYISDSSYNADTEKNLTGLISHKRYYWHVRAANNIGTSSWSPIWSFITPVVIGINEALIEGNIQIFPQPASDNIYIRSNALEGKPVILCLNDLSGRMVITDERIYHNGLVLKTINLKSGIYLLNIILDKQIIVQKVIIE